MAAEIAVQLNWKNKTHPDELIRSIHTLLNECSRVGTANVQFHDSKAESAVQFCKTNREGIPDNNGQFSMWVRFEKTTPRGCRTQRDQEWWGKMTMVAVEAMVRLQARSPERCRMIAYILKNEDLNFDEKAVKTFGINLSLTLGLHPYAIGQIPESVGLVVVPDGFELICREVFNICEFNADTSGRAGIRTTTLSGTAKIPSLINRLYFKRVDAAKGNLRAFMVIEHKNVDMLIDYVKDHSDAFNGVTFVLVSNLPSTMGWYLLAVYRQRDLLAALLAN
jgi:hypothetical protein